MYTCVLLKVIVVSLVHISLFATALYALLFFFFFFLVFEETPLSLLPTPRIPIHSYLAQLQLHEFVY